MQRSSLLVLSRLARRGRGGVSPNAPGISRCLISTGSRTSCTISPTRKAIVIMIQGNGCPIVRNAWPVYRQLRESIRAKGVEFLMLNSNLQDDRSSVLREAETFEWTRRSCSTRRNGSASR